GAVREVDGADVGEQAAPVVVLQHRVVLGAVEPQPGPAGEQGLPSRPVEQGLPHAAPGRPAGDGQLVDIQGGGGVVGGGPELRVGVVVHGDDGDELAGGALLPGEVVPAVRVPRPGEGGRGVLAV